MFLWILPEIINWRECAFPYTRKDHTVFLEANMPVFEGKLIRDAEPRQSKKVGGRDYYVATLVEEFKDSQSTFIQVVAFVSETFAETLKKGAVVRVEGQLSTSPYMDRNGKPAVGLRVSANSKTLVVLKEAPIPAQPALSLAAFYDRLASHDWFYSASDDRSVYARGTEATKILEAIATQSAEHAALMKGFAGHHFSGEPWNTRKQPLPARPQ
jgi:hypothetical protein